MSTSEHTQFSTGAPPMLQAWPDSAIVHGFLGRLGGQSQGVYASMNLSQFVGDDPEDVAANWARLHETVGEGLIYARLHQVHGSEVKVITRSIAAERPAADGMVTSERGIALGIFTADCVPVLMATRDDSAVGALHAGWRGVIAGIATNGIHQMGQLGAMPGQIRVALGPSIGPCCFEVDADLAARFIREIPDSTIHAREGRPGKAYLNLRGILRDQFVAAGVPDGAIENVGPCTRCSSDRYFSRRFAGGTTSGLQLSFIGLSNG